MSYLLKSSREKKKGIPWIFLLVFVLVIAVITFFFPGFFPSLFGAIARPFWKVENSLTGSIGSVFVTKDELITENARLKNTLDTLHNQQLTLSLLQSENEELKTVLGRAGTRTLVLASIIRKPPISPYDTLVIDVGIKEGIKAGDKVLVAGNIILGEIAEVNGELSKVKLYSSPGEQYDVRVGPQNIQTTATGRGGGNFELILPREIKIAEGDTVTIPAISLDVFGTVEAVVGDPARPFQTILFKNPVNIFEQKWVQVLKSS